MLSSQGPSSVCGCQRQSKTLANSKSDSYWGISIRLTANSSEAMKTEGSGITYKLLKNIFFNHKEMLWAILCQKKLDNLDEMGHFLESYKVPKFSP